MSKPSVKLLHQHQQNLQGILRTAMREKLNLPANLAEGLIHSCAEAAEEVIYQQTLFGRKKPYERKVRIVKELLYSYERQQTVVRERNYKCGCGYKYIAEFYTFCPSCGKRIEWLLPDKLTREK